MAPRNRPSSIDRLPPPVQESIAHLRRQGRTVDEILQHLEGLDLDKVPSRSAVGRHVKSLAQIGEQLRRSDSMAQFIVKEFGADTDDRAGRASIAILQGAILELLTEERLDEDGAPVTLSAKEAKEVALALQRLVSAQRVDADRQLRMRAEFAKTAAAQVETAMKAQGMSAETIDLIRNAVLGSADG